MATTFSRGVDCLEIVRGGEDEASARFADAHDLAGLLGHFRRRGAFEEIHLVEVAEEADAVAERGLGVRQPIVALRRFAHGFPDGHAQLAVVGVELPGATAVMIDAELAAGMNGINDPLLVGLDKLPEEVRSGGGAAGDMPLDANAVNGGLARGPGNTPPWHGQRHPSGRGIRIHSHTAPCRGCPCRADRRRS